MRLRRRARKCLRQSARSSPNTSEEFCRVRRRSRGRSRDRSVHIDTEPRRLCRGPIAARRGRRRRPLEHPGLFPFAHAIVREGALGYHFLRGRTRRIPTLRAKFSAPGPAIRMCGRMLHHRRAASMIGFRTRLTTANRSGRDRIVSGRGYEFDGSVLPRRVESEGTGLGETSRTRPSRRCLRS